jgi:hypothetical protein
VQGDGSALAKIHEFILSMVDCSLPLDEQDHIGATLQRRAIQLDLMTGKGVRRAVFMRLVEDCGGMPIINSTWETERAAMTWVSTVLRSGRTVASLATNVLLITTLFSSAQTFREALEQSRSMRKLGEELRKQTTERTNVSLGQTGTTRYIEKRHEKDKLISEAIRRRHASVLASNQQPVRFTRTFFLADIAGCRSIVRKLASYPLSAAAIRELSESREQFLRRLAIWLMRNDPEQRRGSALLAAVQKVVYLTMADLKPIYVELFEGGPMHLPSPS